MGTNYSVVFDYDGKKPFAFVKKKIEKAFVHYYNTYCHAVNPCLEDWNKIYDVVVKKTGQSYDSWMRTRLQDFADECTRHLNKNRKMYGKNIKRFFIGEECNFSAELQNGTKMQFFIKEV